jgi:nicotinate-nucleotide adenylyltransferase
MKVGLYFGSFNPIHIGHLIIANHILNETELKKIWFVVSPQNPFKESATLLDEYDRLELVRKATEEDGRLKASDIEFKLPKPSYTVHTLAYLEERYPEYQFYIIMGTDSYQNLTKWKNADVIINKYHVIIYKRPGFEFVPIPNSTSHLMDAPLLEISATHIRELIQKGKSIKYLVPPSVEEEIYKSNLYRKIQKK